MNNQTNPNKSITDLITDTVKAECLQRVSDLLPSTHYGTKRVIASRVVLSKMDDLHFAVFYLYYPYEIMASYKSAARIDRRRRQLQLKKRVIITPDKANT